MANNQEKSGEDKPNSPLGRIPRPLVFLFGIIGAVYLLNPTAGIIELIPDTIPVLGNLDEGAAAVLVWYSIMEFFKPKKEPQPEIKNVTPDK